MTAGRFAIVSGVLLYAGWLAATLLIDTDETSEIDLDSYMKQFAPLDADGNVIDYLSHKPLITEEKDGVVTIGPFEPEDDKGFYYVYKFRVHTSNWPRADGLKSTLVDSEWTEPQRMERQLREVERDGMSSSAVFWSSDPIPWDTVERRPDARIGTQVSYEITKLKEPGDDTTGNGEGELFWYGLHQEKKTGVVRHYW